MFVSNNAPWREVSTFSIIKRKIFSVMFLIAVMISFVAIFTHNNAIAQGLSSCSRVVVFGDSNGVGIESSGIEDRLKSEGAIRVDFYVQSRRNVSQVAQDIEGANVDGACVIMESGAADLRSSKNKNSDDIRSALNKLNGASHVFWVSPVISESKVSDSLNTRNFNEALSSVTSGNSKAHVVNIQDMSLRESYFSRNGITMSDEGYKERSGKIISAMKDTLNRDDSSSSSSSPQPTSSSGSGGSGGTSGGGGASVSPDSPALSDNQVKDYLGVQNDEGPKPGDAPARAVSPGEDSVIGDFQNSSPYAYSIRAQDMNSFSEASDYLMIQRWGNIFIPSIAFDIRNPESMSSSFFSTITSFLLSTAAFFMRTLVVLVTFLLSSSFGTTSLLIGDYIFGLIFSNNASSHPAAIMSYILSTLIVIIFFISALRMIMSPANFRTRLIDMFTSITKTIFVFTFISMMSFRSSQNGWTYTGDSSVDYGNFAPGDFNAKNDINLDDDPDSIMQSAMRVTDSTINGKSIVQPSTWKSFSFGWVISWIYLLSLKLFSAFAGLVHALVIYPISGLSSAISVQESSIVDEGGHRTACDRYIDSMHLTFYSTNAAQTNEPVQNILSSLDYLYGGFVMRAQRILYGGDTFSSGNSWCYALERFNDTPSGDWLLIARGAGLYKEYAGTGMIIGTNPAVYANGRHSLINPLVNTSPGLPASDGLMVDYRGLWKDPAAPIASERYMGKTGGEEAESESLYYFTACRWDPDKPEVQISNEWNGVRGMGKSGRSWDEIEKDAGKDIDVLPSVSGEYQAMYGNISIPEEPQFAGTLSDIDCKHPTIYPLSDEIGFGSDQEWVKRWNFAKTNPNLVAQIADRTRSALSSGARAAGNIWNKGLAATKDAVADGFDAVGADGVAGDIRDSAAETRRESSPSGGGSDDNPMSKFESSYNDRGYSGAFTFWQSVNGSGKGVAFFGIMAAILCVIISVCIFLICLPVIVIAGIFNWLIALIIIFIPILLITRVIIWALAQTKSKREGSTEG